MKKLLYIARYAAIAVLLLLLSALAPARAQNVVYQGETSKLAVDSMPGETYSWELYNDSTVDFAKVPGACPPALADFVSGNAKASVDVLWKEPGIYFFKVTAWNVSGCTNNIKIGIMKVLAALPTAVIEVDPDSVCEGDWAELIVTFTKDAPWAIKLQAKDVNGTTVTEYGPTSDNPYHIPIGPKLTTEYTVIEVSNVRGVQKKPSNVVILTVHPLPKRTAIYLKSP